MTPTALAGYSNLRHFPKQGNTNSRSKHPPSSLDQKARDKAEIAYTRKPLLISSARATYGEVNTGAALIKLKKLQKSAANGVKFERGRLESSCYGGTCSAQSLRFADDVATSTTKPLHKRVLQVASNSKVADIDHRTDQVALNAISMDTSKSVDDFSKAKVESIVALRNFQVLSSTSSLEELLNNKSIEMSDDSEVNLYRAFKKVVSHLSEGIYFSRLLYSADNHKKEEFGHSIIFIKSQEGNFLWDPADGLYEIPAKELTSTLFKIYRDVTGRWMLELPRFYKIAKKETELSSLQMVEKLPSYAASAASKVYSRIIG